MSADKSLKFFTACGFLFAGDARIGSSSYYRTQRFSNNCGLIEKHWWRECLIDPDLDPSKLSEDAFRYHSEWAIEEASKRQQVAGLRRMDSLGWRVFHVQQWDHRLLATRTKFRKGAGLNRYFNRVHEETLGAFNYYYNFPQPSFFRKFRIYAGKLRRSIFPRRSPQRN
jgi:hypothetical protein